LVWSDMPLKNRGRAGGCGPAPGPPGGGGGGGNPSPRPPFFRGFVAHKTGKMDPPVFNQEFQTGGAPPGGPPGGPPGAPPSPKKSRFWLES
jgi:hypothetical protein